MLHIFVMTSVLLYSFSYFLSQSNADNYCRQLRRNKVLRHHLKYDHGWTEETIQRYFTSFWSSKPRGNKKRPFHLISRDDLPDQLKHLWGSEDDEDEEDEEDEE